ncbi:MAG: hypothetical protein LUD79_07260 [Oscillospiraceae bacterium]|nr:hypothetical protein [Oscillospiraceae bacterium]
MFIEALDILWCRLTRFPVSVYFSRRCAAPAEECLREGRRSFRSLFQRVDVRYIPESALPGFDLEHQLDNLNTPEDYQRAVIQR